MFIRSPAELALLVKNQRKKLGLSQSTVASLVGLEQKTISGFENRPENVKLETLFHILSAINLEIRITSRDALSEQQWNEEW